ncbi:MAG: hypothetical protein ACRDAX_03870 [Propionibacteriaceae bacterium]
MRNSTPFVVVALVVALTACSAPTPPVASPAPTASLDADAALLKEAEDVYRLITEERIRLTKDGGTTTITPTLSHLTEGIYQKKILASLNYQSEKLEKVSGSYSINYLRKAKTEEGAAVTLETCEDARQLTVSDSNGKVLRTGAVAIFYTDFRRIDNYLVAFESKSELVASCK